METPPQGPTRPRQGFKSGPKTTTTGGILKLQFGHHPGVSLLEHFPEKACPRA